MPGREVDSPLSHRPHASAPAADTADGIDRRVAERIALGRRALEIEPAVLDVVLGLRDGTMERLESGRSRATPAHLARLAMLFDVSIDWFFAEKQHRFAAPPAPSAGKPAEAGATSPATPLAGSPADPGRASDPPDPASHRAATPEPPAGREHEDAVEARRFLAAYSRLRHAGVRAEIRALVHAVAERAET
jgi:transcriptional regulator with XRE-family HTH domain